MPEAAPAEAATELVFDLSQVPFSRAGSYACFNILPAFWNCPGVMLRSVRCGGKSRESFRFEPERDGELVPWTTTATPDLLTIHAEGGGTVEICMPEIDVIRVRTRGVGLRCTGHAGKETCFRHADGCWQINSFDTRTQYLLRPLAGRVAVDAVHFVRTQDKRRPQEIPTDPWCTIHLADGAECQFEEFASTPRRHPPETDFAAARAKQTAAWEAFVARTPPVPERYREAARLAMFVNYTSIIGPGGDHVRRPTMLMSKNWMTNCWSWDHCINAIAHAATDPDLAWDQFQVPFDHQDASGCLPDSVGGAGLQRNYTKPPIHGWTLSLMRAANPELLTRERAALARDQLAAWTRWWLEQRDTDGDGLAEYRHGNDSGWDNATVFDLGYPMTAPDLPAYLVLQMDELAALCRFLDDEAGAAEWTRRADEHLATMDRELWTGEQFLARQGFTGARPAAGDSLLNHIAIMLGQRLTPEQRAKLAARLAPDGPFVTAHGPATESPQSELFVDDGYWRGPIWGPETVMVVDGLYRAGERDAALEIARRYCEMCRACRCFAENYNALTGEPLRDLAYTWGSSAFLHLAQLLQRETGA